MWIDNDFPKLLGAELYRPHPAYIIEMAVEPVVVHDFSKQPGQTVQLDRYRFWGKPGTKESRERTADQTLGNGFRTQHRQGQGARHSARVHRSRRYPRFRTTFHLQGGS